MPSIVVKGFLKSARISSEASAFKYKAHFPRHIKKFFSFVNDFLMFSRLSVYCFFHDDVSVSQQEEFFFSFFLHKLLVFSYQRQLKVKIDVCLLNLICYSKKKIFDLRINGKFMNVLFSLTHSTASNNDAIVA